MENSISNYQITCLLLIDNKEISFKSQELSSLYEKLNETKKKLENSKLALKTSHTLLNKTNPSSPSNYILKNPAANYLDSLANNSQINAKNSYDKKIYENNTPPKSLEKVLKSSICEDSSKSYVNFFSYLIFKFNIG